ncbi:MAG: sigma factor [Oscillospiraceae bacterium]
MDYKQQAERLANTYADAILRLSYAYLKNTQDAQDVCQTVFVRLLTEPREFESGEHERAYILRMAANACKDLLKSPWRRRTCDLEACAQVPAPETSDGSVLAAVNQLPAHYRSVIYPFTMRAIRRLRSGRSWGCPRPPSTHGLPGDGRERELLGGIGI